MMRCLSWQKIQCCLFLVHYVSKVFQTLHDFKLAWNLLIQTRVDDLYLFQGYRDVRIINCEKEFFFFFFRFLSTVNIVWLLHTCTLKRSCRVYFVCLLCVFKREIYFLSSDFAFGTRVVWAFALLVSVHWPACKPCLRHLRKHMY